MSEGRSEHSAESGSSSLPRYPATADAGNFPPPGYGRTQAFTTAVAAALSAATWAAWLGWDHSATFDPVTGQVEDPYVTLQVAGCVLTLATLTTVLTALTRRPVLVAAGVSVGFWVPWTVTAVLGDDSGLSLVGSFMVAVGLTAGTAIAAAVGTVLRAAADAVRCWRSRRRVRV